MLQYITHVYDVVVHVCRSYILYVCMYVICVVNMYKNKYVHLLWACKGLSETETQVVWNIIRSSLTILKKCQFHPHPIF